MIAVLTETCKVRKTKNTTFINHTGRWLKIFYTRLFVVYILGYLTTCYWIISVELRRIGEKINHGLFKVTFAPAFLWKDWVNPQHILSRDSQNILTKGKTANHYKTTAIPFITCHCAASVYRSVQTASLLISACARKSVIRAINGVPSIFYKYT
jgi:hypothetical protein